MPQYQKIAYYLKKGIFDGDLTYKPYWTLKDFRNLVKEKDYFNYLEKFIDNNKLKNFLNKTAFVDDGSNQNKDFYNEVEKGGAIIFDESGAHIGSKPSKSDRLVLRFSYKIKNSN